MAAFAAALALAGPAAAQVPDGFPPPTQPTPQLPPPAGLPSPAPRPQLVPADSRITPGTMPFLAVPTPPAPLPVLAPAPTPSPTMTLMKPAGADTARPAALPVSRTIAPQPAPVYAYPTRPLSPPANAAYLPVAAQPPAGPKSPEQKPLDKPYPEKSAEDKSGGLNSPAKDAGKLAPLATVDPNVPAIARDRAFRLDDDAALNKRIVDELVEYERQNNKKFTFDPKDFAVPQPAKVGLSGVAYAAKTASYGPTQALLEPGYVVHRRLLFEEKNSERNGWDLGIIQPVVSTVAFWKDSLLLPAHLASNLTERYDTSAGKCLPGSPVPYYVYPEEITVFGATVGALTIAGTVFAFP